MHRRTAHRRRGGAGVRRRLGAALLLAVGLVGATACSGSPGPERGTGRSTTSVDPGPPDPRPNVVYVVVDDLDALTMPYWDAMPRTAHLLRDRGLTFTNAFVSSPECCPSRATLLTGDYPHNTHIFDSTAPDGGYAVFRDGAEGDTVATRLQGAGYRTAFMGKYLNGYEEKAPAVPPGWDEWWGLGPGFDDGYRYVVNHDGRRVRYGTRSDDYLTDVLADRAVAEVRRDTARNQPFLLSIWPSAPHDEIPPARRDADNPFARASLPRRPDFDEADVSDKPTWLREGERRLTERDLADLTRRYRMMMGSMYAVDDLIARVVEALDARGALDDTYLIFTSDNGYNFGAHRLPHKQAPYEESIRVPLLVAGPGVRHGSEARPVLNNDLVPTILDLAGEPWSDTDGRSLVPLLTAGDAGDPVPWRTDFPIQYHGTYGAYFVYDSLAATVAQIDHRRKLRPDETPLGFVPNFQALRTDHWLYVEWYTKGPHEYELYDLDTDPYELSNLISTPAAAAAHRGVTDQLHARLAQLMTCAGPSCRR